MVEPFELIILDRDGVINDPKGKYYILNKEDFHFREGSIEVLRLLKFIDCDLCICTKQRCIDKGLATLFEIDQIMGYMNEEIKKFGGREIDKWFIEPTFEEKGLIYNDALLYYSAKSQNILVLDDDIKNIRKANSLGMFGLWIFDGFDLFVALTILIKQGYLKPGKDVYSRRFPKIKEMC